MPPPHLRTVQTTIDWYIFYLNSLSFIEAAVAAKTGALWRSGYRARLEILFLRERQFESGQRRSFCPRGGQRGDLSG